MTHTRAQISLETGKDVSQFIQELNSYDSDGKWMLENFDGTYRVNARSFLGVMYASVEWNGEIYLYKADAENFEFPAFIDKYRV